MNDDSTHPKEEVVETVFNAALAFESSQREEYLAQACGNDLELRKRVQALLIAHQASEGFLPQKPGGGGGEGRISGLACEGGPGGETIPLIEQPGDWVGRYKLREKIGEGGCGVVYVAEQEEPVRRRVALKVVKLGMDTRSVIARFEAERQALALMDHPNIAKVLDAGASQTGRPYFVMELVRGPKITDYCDQNQLTTPQRLELFIKVCQAVQHAHQKGIIHRDIKPSNILVTVNDGVAVPKVIDFGIAKATAGRLTDKTIYTAFEQFIGTPAYMSPEQAVMTSVDIDTRSDIYSLGVLLYELLTGKTPFDTKELLAAGLDAMRRTIREKEPERPSTRLSTMQEAELSTAAKQRQCDPTRLAHLLRGDLDWIAMKALEKDRARRYETANSLAADVSRFLADEPVIARPPSHVYRLQKLARRNKLTFAAAACVAAALVLGLGIATWMFLRQRIALQRALIAETKAQTEAAKSQQVGRFLQEMLRAVGPEVARGRDTTLLRKILEDAAWRLDNELKGQPEVNADLRQIIGQVYAELADYKKAEAFQREALRIRKSLGQTNEALADTLWELSYTLDHVDSAEAEVTAREALDIRRKLFGNTDERVAYSIDSVAAALAHEGKFEEAETLYREGLALTKKLEGEQAPQYAITLHNLGEAFYNHGQLLQAETMFRDALAHHTSRGDTNSPLMASTLESLASVLRAEGDAGKLAEAEMTAREAVGLFKELYRDSPENMRDALQVLIGVLFDEGKWGECESTVREQLLVVQKIGTNDVVTGLFNLCLALEKQGKLGEAERVGREALALSKTLGNNERVVQALMRFAGPLSSSGKVDEAQAAYYEAVVLDKDECADQQMALYNLVESLERKGKLLSEAPILMDKLPQRAKGSRDFVLRGWLTSLMLSGNFDEAQTIFHDQASQTNRIGLKPADFTAIRGSVFAHRGRWPEATADLTKVIDVNPDDAGSWNALAAIYIQTKDLDAYREHCRKAIDRFKNSKDAAGAGLVANFCLYLPPSPTDVEVLGKMADSAARAWPWYAFTKGLAEYRQAHFGGALSWLERSNRDEEEEATYLLKAMAWQQIAQPEKARATLTKAIELHERKKLAKDQAGELGNDWVEWIFAKPLLAEAKAIVGGQGAATAQAK